MQSVSDILSSEYGITAVPGRKCECPFCHKKSFSIKQNDEFGRCFHPVCGRSIVVNAERREGGVSSPKPRATVQPTSGCTLDAYSSAKKLPLDFLKRLGLSEITYMGSKAVRIPYLDEAGHETAIRFRTALRKDADGDNRFKWKKGAQILPYGLWRLPEARKLNYITLVEGESDAQTLWYSDIPALGIPGAATWKDSWAQYLEGIEKIYVSVEPDSGGEAVIKWLADCAFRDRVRLLDFASVKDPSALYVRDPDGFRAAWSAILKKAIPFKEHKRIYIERRKSELWEKCRQIAISPNILDLICSALTKRGHVGETKLIKILYLAVTSRLLSKIISVAVKGPSSGGKSHSVEHVLSLFPKSAYYDLTSMSEKALAYSSEPLQHRILVIYEASGADNEFSNYLIRSLLSEGKIKYVTVEKINNKHEARLIERAGPTGLLLTTTRSKLHPENETRLLSLTVTDTAEQTRNILISIAESRDCLIDISPFIALQEWLELNNSEVVLFYASQLACSIPPIAIRLRRDFHVLLSFIRSHALLHQANRRRDDQGRIIAEIEDYKVIQELTNDIFSDGVDASIPGIIRETVSAVKSLLPHSNDEVNVTSIAKYLKLDKSTAWRRVNDAIFRGYLINLEDRKGKPARIKLGDPLPYEMTILPHPSLLSGCTVAQSSGEPHPPPAVSGLPSEISAWSDDWREKYEERAAILEHEGGLSPHEAQVRAQECIRSEFHNFMAQ